VHEKECAMNGMMNLDYRTQERIEHEDGVAQNKKNTRERDKTRENERQREKGHSRERQEYSKRAFWREKGATCRPWTMA